MNTKTPMVSDLRKLFGLPEYQPLNLIEICQKNILDNLEYLKSLDQKIQIAPVLKSNAYGHGIKLIAQLLDDRNSPFFCVDSLYEAYELLKLKVKTPILIMGYVDKENLKIKKVPFSFAVYDLETVIALRQLQPQAPIHIFVDTGMSREGVTLEELPDFLIEIKKLGGVNIEGLMSHLSSASSLNDPLFRHQIQNFQKAKKVFDSYKIKLKWTHLSASSGILETGCRSEISKITNLARTGLSLYGFDPNGKDNNLKPALQFKTKLVQIKKLPKGASVGYDGTFKTTKPTIIGILPAGYFDGVDRRLSNKGCVMVKNVACPIVGRVSMNLTTIDLTDLQNPNVGDTAIIYSNFPTDPNSISNASKLCQTVPYDLLVNLASSTRRELI